MDASTSHLSDFLLSLQIQGYSVYLSVQFTENQSGFYSLLAAAMGLHRAKDYGELNGYLRQLWSQRFPNYWGIEDMEDWERLGNALRMDIYERFQSETWANLLLLQQVPDKASEAIWTSLMDYLSIQLTWVEMTSTDRSLRTYAPASTETLRLFVTFAQESPWLHLLTHRDFGGTARPGFPFFASPQEWEYREERPIYTVKNQACKTVTHIQAEIINNLLRIYSHTDSLPADSKPQQTYVNTLYRHIQPLSSSIDSTALQGFLRLTEVKPPSVSVSSPTLPTNACVSCEKVWSPSALWRAEHGCALCMKCCFQQKDGSACLKCRKPLSIRDFKTLKMFDNLTVSKFS